MGSLSAALRAELEALEVELADDPRVRKATIILELLEIYGALPSFAGCSDTSSGYQSGSSTVVKRSLSFHRIRSTIRMIVRGRGTADLARARLGEMATNRWPSTPSEWLDRQTSFAATSTDEKVQQAPSSKITSEGAYPKLALS
jgi:hypothetical protein